MFPFFFLPRLFQCLGSREHWTQPHTAFREQTRAQLSLLHTHELPTGSERLLDLKPQRLRALHRVVLPFGGVPCLAGLGTSPPQKQERGGKQEGTGIRAAPACRSQPYSQRCRWLVHLCHFLFLQQLPSSLLDPGRSRKAEKSLQFQVPGSEKLQIKCEKHSLRAHSSWFLYTDLLCDLVATLWAPPWERESTGANLNPNQPCRESSYLKKRLLCFTSELPNAQSWPPAYAQQQQRWLIAHLSTVHASSCNATGNQQPRPTLGLCHPDARNRNKAQHPSAEMEVSALPGENHTANITRLVFLAIAERRLQDLACGFKDGVEGKKNFKKRSIFTLLLASSVQISTARRAGDRVLLLLITVKMSCQVARQTG